MARLRLVVWVAVTAGTRAGTPMSTLWFCDAASILRGRRGVRGSEAMMKASKQFIHGVAALLCAGFGVFCDRADGGEEPRESHVMVCDYDTFEVEITAGPSAGLRLAGQLMIFRERPNGEFTGLLRTPTGDEVFATGALYESGDIALNFHTAGGYVMGLGRVGDNFCKPGAMLEGVAIGPKVAPDNALDLTDSGHWLLNSPSLLLDGGGLVFTPLTPEEGLVDGGDGFEFAKVSCLSGTRLSDSCCKSGKVTICENGGQECSFDYGQSPPTKSCSDDATKGQIVF